MDFDGILHGLSVALQPGNLIAALIGVIAGNLVGILPGIGPIGAAAILFPLTLTMDPAAGVIMIAGIYLGSQFGGAITSILLRIPGEASSIAAMYDGNAMTKKGRGGAALGIAILGSFFAGTLVVVGVTFFTPMLTGVALSFRQPELFALTAGGLILVSTVIGTGGLRSIVPMLWGVLCAVIGQDLLTGDARFTFGNRELFDGIGVESVAIGMFGLAELMIMATLIGKSPNIGRIRVRDMFPNRSELRRAAPAWARGGVLGFFIGLLPGPSSVLASFLSYKTEKSISKRKDEFGHGAPEGIAGPEAANNAAATAGVVPVLGLGIPFSVTLAFMLAAMTSHGVTPGPLLMRNNPDIYWGVIASMFVANILLVLLNIPLIGLWIRMLRIPQKILIPSILLLATYAAYASELSFMAIFAALAFATLGTFLVLGRFDLAPFLLGFIVGPMVETYGRQALAVGGGDPAYLISGPISPIIWAVVGSGVVVPIVFRIARSRRASKNIVLRPAERDREENTV